MSRAVKRASKRSGKAWLEVLVLGQASPPAFARLIDAVAEELPAVIAEDEPEWARENEGLIRRGCERAIRAAVAGTAESDQVATQILDVGGRGGRTRQEWLVLSASATAITIGSAAAYLGVGALTDTTAASVVAALVAAAGGVAALSVKVGADVRHAHFALRSLVDALLVPNVGRWKPASLIDQRHPRALAGPIAEELSRIVESTGYAATSRRPAKEALWRWDGSELEAIRAAAETADAALDRLEGGGEWRGPDCIVRRIEQLSSDPPHHDPLESELRYGGVVFELLICCAAVALELDRALDLLAPPSAEAA